MIDYTSYTLTNRNYHGQIHDKKQIVIGNTFNTGMNHFTGWVNRANGYYKKVSNYTIDYNGVIYEHFDPKYYSDFIPNSIYNKHIITILLENQGWFDYDVLDKKFINCYGIIYSGDNMTEKRWRNHSFWDNYSESQMKSLCDLTKTLLEKFKISNKVLNHNTYIRDIANFEGVSYRSNWIKDCTDLSPSFNFEIFKNKVEDHEIQ